jgi:excisionase family DNA binding protein
MTGQRATTKEAAEALGISVEAVRKRIERGQLEHERVDGRVYVYLDEDRTVSGPDVEVESTALISEMLARIELLERQLEQANERDRENRRLLAAALERIPPQLEAPQEPTEAPERAPEHHDAHMPRSGTEAPHAARERPFTEEAETAAPRPWWRRLFQS